MFYDNSYNFMITLSLNMIMHIIKNNNKSNNTQLAHIELEPKSSHTTKYSQPFELSTFPRHTCQN